MYKTSAECCGFCLWCQIQSAAMC